jgi:hypothetical protein
LIKVLIYIASNKAANVTNMVESITWSGDIGNLFRKADISLKNINGAKSDKVLFNYKLGNLVTIHSDEKEIFRGYIFNKSIDTDGNDTFVAYDELVYAGKNSTSLIVKNRLASEVINSEFKKFGITIGSIESTRYKIPKKVIQNQSLSEMVKILLEETTKNTGVNYVLNSSKGKVYLRSRANSQKLTISIDDIISGSNDSSIEELRNQVVVYKGSLEGGKDTQKYETYTVKDSSSFNKYGIMQHMESVDDDSSLSTMKNKANSLLKQLNKPEETLKIEFLGNVLCTTGNIIEVRNGVTNMSGRYYITSDSHTFSGGIHKMSLQLSKKI